jgi:hypothetical protein
MHAGRRLVFRGRRFQISRSAVASRWWPTVGRGLVKVHSLQRTCGICCRAWCLSITSLDSGSGLVGQVLPGCDGAGGRPG